MDEKKYQVFISSTYTDLINARAKVSEQILTMYHFPIGMEMFSAGDDDQWTVITNTIDKSDYYVIILGNRYGSLAEGGISYTEKEYDYAKSKGIPIMAFIKDRNVPTLPAERESDPEIIKKLDNFIDKAKQNKMCNFWKNEDELSAQVTASLYKAFYSTPRIGWIRADTIDTAKTLGEITALSAENRELKAELEALRKEQIVKVPDLQASINEKSNLQILFKKDIQVGKLDLLTPIYEEDIPQNLKELITDEEVENYNSLFEAANEEINEYNLTIENYRKSQELGLECSINLSNQGNCKATNIYVDIEFPKEIQIIEGGLDSLSIPTTPQLPKNPIEVAKRKIKKRAPMDYSSLLGLKGFPEEIKLSSRYTGIPSSMLTYDKNNYVRIKENEVTVFCSSMMHTRMRTFEGKFLIVPLSIGEFTIKVNVICEEYAEPTTQFITLNVIEENI